MSKSPTRKPHLFLSNNKEKPLQILNSSWHQKLGPGLKPYPWQCLVAYRLGQAHDRAGHHQVPDQLGPQLGQLEPYKPSITKRHHHTPLHPQKLQAFRQTLSLKHRRPFSALREGVSEEEKVRYKD